MGNSLLVIAELIRGSTVMIMAVVVVIIAILVYLSRGKLKVGRFSLELDRGIEAQVEQIRKQIPPESLKASPADRQYLLLREYYAQGLAQSKISFWFSLFFASLGFIVIIIAILGIEKNVQLTQQGRTFIILLAGTIIDAVSALFFVQSNRARRLMTTFFDSLRADKNLEESLRLSAQVPDPILQSKLQILLALNLANVKSTDSTLSSLLDTEHQSVKANETPQKGPVKVKRHKAKTARN